MARYDELLKLLNNKNRLITLIFIKINLLLIWVNKEHRRINLILTCLARWCNKPIQMMTCNHSSSAVMKAHRKAYCLVISQEPKQVLHHVLRLFADSHNNNENSNRGWYSITTVHSEPARICAWAHNVHHNNCHHSVQRSNVAEGQEPVEAQQLLLYQLPYLQN